ncbi:MAG: hypothetical protein IKT43_03245 [Clostridia bacterium]|nr:hypothetical protein [Clostridia bacterium]
METRKTKRKKRKRDSAKEKPKKKKQKTQPFTVAFFCVKGCLPCAKGL